MDIPEEVRISDLMVCKVGKLTKSISVRTGIESIKEDIIFKTICYNPRGTDTYIDLNDGNIYIDLGIAGLILNAKRLN